MATKQRTKFVHEGQYAAEVEVQWIEADTGWSPYLTLEDTQRIDQLREALRNGDLKKASQFGPIYQLTRLKV